MSHLPKVRSAPLVLGRVAVPVNQIGGEAPHKYGDTGQPIPPGLCGGLERLRRHQSDNGVGIDRYLQNLAAERLRRPRAELGRDADGSDGPETSVRAVHAAEQVKEALAYVRAVEKRLRAVQRLLVADADNNGADRAGTTGGRDSDSRKQF